MHVRNLIAVCFTVALTLPACDSKSDAKSGEVKSGEVKTGEKKDDKKAAGDAKAAAPSKLELGKVPLTADAPAGTNVSDGIGGAGVMVMGENLVVNVDAATDMTPKTLEDAKKDAEMYTPKNFKEEKLADGYALTFENEGGMGTNYHVSVRRELAGKAWSCTTMQSNTEQQSTALAFCKSLAAK